MLVVVGTGEGGGLPWRAAGAVPATVGVSGQHTVLAAPSVVGAARHVQLDQLPAAVDEQHLLWGTRRSEKHRKAREGRRCAHSRSRGGEMSRARAFPGGRAGTQR